MCIAFTDRIGQGAVISHHRWIERRKAAHTKEKKREKMLKPFLTFPLNLQIPKNFIIKFAIYSDSKLLKIEDINSFDSSSIIIISKI